MAINKINLNGTTYDIGEAAGTDTSESVVEFSSADEENPSSADESVALMKSGDTHKSLLEKISAGMKNIRYLLKQVTSLNSALAEINSSAKFGNLGSVSIGEAVNMSTIPDVVLYVHDLLSNYMTCVAWVNVSLSGGGNDSILLIGGRQSATRGRYFCMVRTTNNIYNCRLTSESEVEVTRVTMSS